MQHALIRGMELLLLQRRGFEDTGYGTICHDCGGIRIAHKGSYASDEAMAAHRNDEHGGKPIVPTRATRSRAKRT